MSASRTRFTRSSPLSNLKELAIMFETLELQYLNKLIESKVRDFASPEAFQVSVKVECLGGDGIKSSTKVSGKFPVPISALVSNFTIQTRKCSDTTPPIMRTFYLATDGFVEIAELVQGMLQRLRMLNLLTRVQGQNKSPCRI